MLYHILNDSLFSAYTMAKYGMSMCVLGMAEELKADNIAVNALWPKTGMCKFVDTYFVIFILVTVIWTAAMEMVGGDAVKPYCRKVDIVADAAYALLSRDSRNFTGHFAIDEDILREEGVTDFAKYSVQQGMMRFVLPILLIAGAPLMPDYFLGDSMPQLPKDKKQSKSSAGAAASGSSADVHSVFDAMKSAITPDIVKQICANFEFRLTGTRFVFEIYLN
jgi:hypothetical protein